jgi:septal ring factor EnvC (AmiA/AmiB activator)
VKKLWNLLVLTLALNFVALAAGVAWLYQAGRLDHARVVAVKEILFPPPASVAPSTQPADEAPTAPSSSKRLEELLSKMSGKRTAAEQVEFIQQTFDTTMAQLDRRQRVIEDLEGQIARANQKLAEDRKALDADRGALVAREKEAERLAGDKGFQDTLELYNSMPPRQVKALFMTADELTVAQYLDAMQPRTAARIIKEFKTPEELDRMKRVLEKMRRPPQSSPAAVAATPDTKE